MVNLLSWIHVLLYNQKQVLNQLYTCTYCSVFGTEIAGEAKQQSNPLKCDWAIFRFDNYCL